MQPLFIATQKFDPSDGEKWRSYVGWANLPQLVEVVSLDGILCPRLVGELTDEDWLHNVQENYLLNYFYDLDYLLRRVADVSRRNILGFYRNPDHHTEVPPAAGPFFFVGYDLVEQGGEISALTNCGGFPETFSNDDLNSCGLLSDFARAIEVRRLLIANNPGEPHANCDLYAIWRLADRGNDS